MVTGAVNVEKGKQGFQETQRSEADTSLDGVEFNGEGLAGDEEFYAYMDDMHNSADAFLSRLDDEERREFLEREGWSTDTIPTDADDLSDAAFDTAHKIASDAVNGDSSEHELMESLRG